MAPPLGEDNPIVRECGSKWGAKKALIHFRDCMLEQGDTPVEEWTSAHDLLCIMLDLGADAGVEDGMKRKAGWNCTSKSVQALLSSDWELGEKTVKGHLVAEDTGDIVDSRGEVVHDNSTSDNKGDEENSGLADDLANAFSGLSVDLTPTDAEEEGLYSRMRRAEILLKEWHRCNGAELRRSIQNWPYEDALKNFGMWSTEDHPARHASKMDEKEEKEAAVEIIPEHEHEYEYEAT